MRLKYGHTILNTAVQRRDERDHKSREELVPSVLESMLTRGVGAPRVAPIRVGTSYDRLVAQETQIAGYGAGTPTEPASFCALHRAPEGAICAGR
jgi:hypothetical protein